MMATWDLQITPLDTERREVSVLAIRTDGSDVREFRIISAIINTPEQKQDCLNNIRGQWLASKEKSDVVDVFVGDLETAGKAALEAMEI